jgi:chaperonin GroES
MSKLKPKNGYLVLRPIEEDETMYGNIIIPDLGKERPELGEVIATSSTYNFHSDQKIPSEFRVGDKALIPKLGSVRITVDSEEYFICKEQDVYSILVDEDQENQSVEEPKIY